MFVAQAHSFVQQARLAITLAWVAGYTNILTILTCGVVTSHVSGTTSNLGRDVAEGSWGLAALALFLLATFFIGAMVSGAATELGRRRGWESIYVLPMAIEAALLATFALGVEMHDPEVRETGATLYWLTGVASTAMGLQNATITRISGGVVRTTHVTGTLTDLGLETTQFLLWVWDRRRDFPPGASRAIVHSVAVHPSARRLALLVSILGSFALGAGLGTLAFGVFPAYAMFPPVLFLLWIIGQDVARPIAELEPSDLVGRSKGLDLPAALAVYHLRRGKNGGAGIHRMPNLLAWADRLPEATRVVILDLADVKQLQENSGLELRAALMKLESQGRRLVLSGITPEQFRQLQEAGAGDQLQVMDVCTDLELAIARGLMALEDLGLARAAG
jgi:uncharacterized membrane protein YoaK (UPF0700 family)